MQNNPSNASAKAYSFAHGDLSPGQSFFARACLQPYLESLECTHTVPFDSDLAGAGHPDGRLDEERPLRRCPFCGRKPQVAVLSDEPLPAGMMGGSAEGGRRFLTCGDCLTTWPFQRVACALCEEGAPHKLPYYSTKEIPNVRVDCCESCMHYIKSIDLTKDRRPVPLVDELAAIPLDLWAQEQGYTKIQPNLAGI